MKKETEKRVMFMSVLDNESISEAMPNNQLDKNEESVKKNIADLLKCSSGLTAHGFRIMKITFEIEKEITPFTELKNKTNKIDWGF